jgi:hypothetical protein
MTRFSARTLLPLALLVPWAGQAGAVEQGDFHGPGMEGFVKVQEYAADGDEDGVKETRVRRFKNLDGDRMFTMTSGELLWAWSVDTAASATLEGDYVLRDSDCDGRFDERYGLDEEFKVPDCLK